MIDPSFARTFFVLLFVMLMMLLADFSRPVVIANLIAWPVAYVLMRGYLSFFTQSTELDIGPFVASLALTVSIAWVAVSAQAIRAALVKPAAILRHE